MGGFHLPVIAYNRSITQIPHSSEQQLSLCPVPPTPFPKVLASPSTSLLVGTQLPLLSVCCLYGPSSLLTYAQISRKSYLQGLEVAYDIVTQDSRIFGSVEGVVNEQMKITLDQSTSLPLMAQEDEFALDFTFYYSVKPVKDAEQLVDDQAVCNKIHVVKVLPALVFLSAPNSHPKL